MHSLHGFFEFCAANQKVCVIENPTGSLMWLKTPWMKNVANLGIFIGSRTACTRGINARPCSVLTSCHPCICCAISRISMPHGAKFGKRPVAVFDIVRGGIPGLFLCSCCNGSVRALNLKTAYKQLARHPADSWATILAVYNPDDDGVHYFEAVALPFGGASARVFWDGKYLERISLSPSRGR